MGDQYGGSIWEINMGDQYGGNFAMEGILLWEEFCYEGNFAMEGILLWGEFCYGGNFAMRGINMRDQYGGVKFHST